jgi:hypothetical protein
LRAFTLCASFSFQAGCARDDRHARGCVTDGRLPRVIHDRAVAGLAAVLTIWGIAFIWIIAFGVARISDELRRRRLDALRDIADARAAVKDEPPYLGTWRGGRFE